MKKLLYSVAALALAFSAASCQQENLEPVSGNNTVTYTIQVPGATATKAIGEDVAAVTELLYEVYLTEATAEDQYDAKETWLYDGQATISNGTATINLELVNNQNFRVLFWAQVSGTGIYDTENLKAVKMSTALDANQESYAAFSGSDYIKYGDNLLGRTVTLYRPVSQINIATTAESLTLGEDENGANAQTTISFKETGVTVTGLSTTYNIATGAPAADNTEFTYAAKPVSLSESTIKVNNVDYTYVGMNYVGFAPVTGDNVEVAYTITTNEVGVITNTIDNVPVKPNYRTNIIGNLLTSTSDYTITLSREWGGSEDVIVAEGSVESILGADVVQYFGYGSTVTDDMVIDGKYQTITDWVDAWYGGNLTVKNLTFKQGATFSARPNTVGVITFENCTFYACDQTQLKDFAVAGSNYLSDGRRFDNSGDGMCLDIDTKDCQVAVVVKNCSFVGDGGNNVDRNGFYNVDALLNGTRGKARGYGLAINGIAGRGDAESVLVDGCVFDNIRDNAIQLYTFEYPITIQNCEINGWGHNSADIAGTHTGAGVRGDMKDAGDGTAVSEASLNLVNNYFGEDETATHLHVLVDRYNENTDGTRPADWYSGLYPVGISKNGDVWEISSVKGLLYANEHLFKTNSSYKLVADLDMSGVLWNSNVTQTNNIAFDGDGHTISNWETTSGALLAPMSNYTVNVSNLTLVDCRVETNSNYAGLLVGYADANTVTIKNCHILGSSVSGADYVAGFVGWSTYNINIESSSIKNSEFNGGGSTGAYLGHCVGDDSGVANIDGAVVEDCVVTGETLAKSGAVIGTVNVGTAYLNTSSVKRNKVFDIADSDAFVGRIVGGTLILDGANALTSTMIATTPITKSGTYILMGSFADPVIQVNKGIDVVLDGSVADITGHVKVHYPGGDWVIGSSAVFYNAQTGSLVAKEGSYTLKNITAKELSVSCYNTSVNILDNTLEFLDYDGGNVILTIDGNDIDAKNVAHDRMQGSGHEYGCYLAMTSYDLTFTGNTIKNTLSFVVGINGLEADLGASVPTENKITSFAGNNLEVKSPTKSRAGLKIFADETYAPQGTLEQPANQKAQELMTLLKDSSNNITKAADAGYASYMFDIYGTLYDEI